MLQALPVMLILFLLFPRIPGPFWALPKASGAGVTGLSEEMSPGTLAQLSLSDEVAFRVNFAGQAPPSSRLYWRGPVLDTFDGRNWSRSNWSALPADMSSLSYQGPATDYTVSLMPNGKPWLLALDLPSQPLPPDARLNRQLQLVSLKPVNDRISYTLSSYLDYQTLGPLSQRETSTYTRDDGHWVTAVGYGRDPQENPDPAILIVHNPVATTPNRRSYIRITQLPAGRIEGASKNYTFSAKGTYQISRGITPKKGTDCALLDGAAVLKLGG